MSLVSPGSFVGNVALMAARGLNLSMMALIMLAFGIGLAAAPSRHTLTRGTASVARRDA